MRFVMSKQFSFIENDFEVILSYAHTLLPGIEKVIAVYYDEPTDSLLSKIVEKPKENTPVRNYSIVDSKDVLARYRAENTRFNWFKKDDLPFDLPKSKENTSDIFTEVENIVLLLKFRSEKDKLNDLLFLYFKPNLSNFKLSRDDRPLSTENKSIIASLLHSFLNTLKDQNKNNRAILKSVNENTKALINEAAALREELNRTKLNYSESLINLCLQYVKGYSETNRKTYKLSEGALKKIQTFKGNIYHLKSIIANTITYIDNLNFENGMEEILIREWHINLENYQVQETTNSSQYTLEGNYLKTLHLLDKYENAAQSVISKNDNLTSINVGKACPDPISAPAITDSLRKHKKKILYLFDKYPEKWEMLRRDFRPVRNLSQ